MTAKEIVLKGPTPITDAWRAAGGPALPFADPLAEAARWEAAGWEAQQDGCEEWAERCVQRAVNILAAAGFDLTARNGQAKAAPVAEWQRAARGAWT